MEMVGKKVAERKKVDVADFSSIFLLQAFQNAPSYFECPKIQTVHDVQPPRKLNVEEAEEESQHRTAFENVSHDSTK